MEWEIRTTRWYLWSKALCVKLWNGHHITLISQIIFKKGSIDNDVLYDILYDYDDGHKDNDHDNSANYGENDNW